MDRVSNPPKACAAPPLEPQDLSGQGPFGLPWATAIGVCVAQNEQFTKLESSVQATSAFRSC
eukprot:13655430-Alexandrium_andersonii.AAC.1